MRRRPLVASLGFVVIAAVVWLGVTVGLGHRPLLGLDLQGGASVVLKPTHKVDNSVLNQAISIIRRRVDGLGVAEPNISRQGTNVVIELPGIKDPQDALKVVGQTAQLRFRQMYCQIPLQSGKAKPAKNFVPTATDCPGASATASAKAASLPTTPDVAGKAVILPQLDAKGNPTTRYILGPTLLSGNVVSSATAQAPQTGSYWTVLVNFTSSGSSKFDAMAAKYYQQYIAIELDGIVESVPQIQAKSYNGTAQISGNFTEADANNLALELRYGSLPVQFQPQQIQTVSASIGKDSLRAGLLAGAVGIALVLIYMLFYYRILGLVVLAGLVVSGALIYSILAELSISNGLALSLAGVTGIIVSVGVTVDSYVVYFERLKDEVRSGRSVRTSVDRGFARAYRTILTADFVSFAAAAILYALTVGSVRGFAFTLGLSTLLDVVVAYLFIRPLVILLGYNRRLTEGRYFGVARGLGVGYEIAGEPA